MRRDGRARRFPGQRGGLTRTERSDHNRRKRARAHLEQVRGGARKPVDPGWRTAAGLMVAFLAAGALCGGWLFTALAGLLTGEPAHLEAICVRGVERLSGDEVAAATGVEPGAALTSVDAEAVAARLEDHDWIAAARAVRLPIGTLLVDVRERVAVATTPAGQPPAAFFVDASGTPFAEAAGDAAAALPRLVPAEPAATREPNTELAEAARLAHRLSAFGLPRPAEVSIAAEDDPEGFAVRLTDRPARVVLGRSDLDRKLALLARLLAEGIPELADASSLDLRFADQVVLRNEPTPKGPAQAAAARGRAAPSTSRPAG
jgi:cell division septal protein FtsQ